MGIDLMKNFERPYFSKSITEFWRRWHISYQPGLGIICTFLGGTEKDIFAPFEFIHSISGQRSWHGASWTFVIWGALNGVAIVIEKILG